MINKQCLAVVFFVITSCNSDYVSKPRGYFEIKIKPTHYQNFNRAGFPFDFVYNANSVFLQSGEYFGMKPENNYWFNLEYPEHEAGLFFSYKKIGDKQTLKHQQPDGTYKDSLVENKFEQLIKDAFKITYSNSSAAGSIAEKQFVSDYGVRGLMFDVSGDAATNYQFYATDTFNHFLRCALYFKATPNSDSLRPLLDTMIKDIKTITKTLKWNK